MPSAPTGPLAWPPVSPDWAVASRRGGGVIVPVPPGISGSALAALSPSWPGRSTPGEPVIAGSPVPRSSFIVSEPNAGPRPCVRSAGGTPTPVAASRPARATARTAAGTGPEGAAGGGSHDPWPLNTITSPRSMPRTRYTSLFTSTRSPTRSVSSMDPDGIRNASTAQALMPTVNPAASRSRNANPRQNRIRRGRACGRLAGAVPG